MCVSPELPAFRVRKLIKIAVRTVVLLLINGMLEVISPIRIGRLARLL